MANINSKIEVKALLAAKVKNPVRDLLHSQTAELAGIQTRAALMIKNSVGLKNIKTARDLWRFYWGAYRYNSTVL